MRKQVNKIVAIGLSFLVGITAINFPKIDVHAAESIIVNGTFDKDGTICTDGWGIGAATSQTPAVTVLKDEFDQVDSSAWTIKGVKAVAEKYGDNNNSALKLPAVSKPTVRTMTSKMVSVEGTTSLDVAVKVSYASATVTVRQYGANGETLDKNITLTQPSGMTGVWYDYKQNVVLESDCKSVELYFYIANSTRSVCYIDDVSITYTKAGETTWSDGILSDNGNYKLKLSNKAEATYSGATFEEGEWYEYSFEATTKNTSEGFTYGLLVDDAQKTALTGLFNAKASTTIGFFTDGTGEAYFDNLVVTKHEHKFEDIVSDNTFVSAADCTHPATYNKSCRACGTKGTETFTSGEALGHDTTPVAEDPATCTKDGVKAHYKCNNCNEKFADAEATTSQTDDDLKLNKHTQTFHKEVPNSCTEDGVKAYYECSCGKYYEDEACTKELKKEDLSIARHNHKNAEKVDAKPASCTEDGNIEYWACPDCSTNFTDAACTQVAETIVDSAKGHDVEYVAEVKATCTKDGKEAYYVCKNCEKTFADKECKTEKTPQIIKKHTRKYYKKVSATYTKTGVNAHYKCSCGKYYTTSGKLTTLKSLTLAKTPVNKTKVTKVTRKSKALAIKWKKTSSVNGYEVQVALDKNFKKGLKKTTVKSAKTTSVTVKKLKAKKTYYVRVRTYKVVSGKKVYSSWTTVSKTKTK